MGHVASGVLLHDTNPCCFASRLCITFLRITPRFQAAECRSSALPTGRVLSLFGTVSHTSYQQALAGLSPLNFSQPKGFPSVSEGVMPRSVCLATAELPALACVERTIERLETLGPDPTGGFGHGALWLATSPTSMSTATRSFTLRSFSVVPPPRLRVYHEIE